MQRHITDRTRARDGAIRAREYQRFEMQQGPNAASVALQKRPHAISVGRLRQYLRIARGRTA